MVIAVFGRSIEESFLPYLVELTTLLNEQGVVWVCEKNFDDFLQEAYGFKGGRDVFFDRESLMAYEPDLLLSVGGDGTFLDAAVYVTGTDIPILGVNSGRLGFLANVSSEEIREAVEYITGRCYTVERRDVLELEADGEVMPGFDHALNEISILKTDATSLLKIHAYIGEVYLTTYWADGLIVATPTGSTAYSLSGGGPIVSPDCDNIILTPVCPHNLNMRSLVVPNRAEINLRVESREKGFVLSMDSRMKRMDERSRLCIRSGGKKVRIVNLPGHDYYRTLRNKLMWGEDRRNF